MKAADVPQKGARFVADERGILAHGSRKRKRPAPTIISPADAFLRGLSSGPLASSLGQFARFGFADERTAAVEHD